MARPTEIVNAQIQSTHLGFEDHGIFTGYLNFRWPGAGCGFGGRALGSDNKERLSGYGTAWIVRVLRTLGVEKWEDLNGLYARIECEGPGGRILRIGHITEDKWFDPEALREELGL